MDLSDDEREAAVSAMEVFGYALVNAILERAPIATIQELLDDNAPLWWQDADGWSALHAAAEAENEGLVQMLLERGAVWNAVDNNGNTAGDIALSLNNEACYTLIRDAGIRTELLLSLLSTKPEPFQSPAAMILHATDTSASGSQETFLSSRLKFAKDSNGQDVCSVVADGQEVGVMMGWERDIMRASVGRLCLSHERLGRGLKVLNVGFGLGIIDTFFQNLPTPPELHVIIEPHPDVLAHMKAQGWYDRPGVRVLEGKWQDFVESEAIASIGGFDVVYTDTFSEHYKDLQQFFGHVPDLLSGPESRFGFFNGLGATNALFYDVYTHLTELSLAELGVDVEWSDVDVLRGESERWGESRKYFTQRLYRMPVSKMRSG